VTGVNALGSITDLGYTIEVRRIGADAYIKAGAKFYQDRYGSPRGNALV